MAPRDDEAYASGRREMRRPRGPHLLFGKEDNFWEHGSGPCGPCSEIYYHRGEYGCGARLHRGLRLRPVYGNLERRVHPVQQRRTGHYTELKQKNVDTGMGLERTISVLTGKKSVYRDGRLFTDILAKIGELCGKSTARSEETPAPSASWPTTCAPPP